MEQRIEQLEKEIIALREQLEGFEPIVVKLRLDDNQVHFVTLFAKNPRPKFPTFSVVS